jgi:type I restriction enzyme S subunit
MKAQKDNTWNHCRLGDLVQIKHGYAFKGEFFADSGPYVLLTPGNFREEGGFRDRGDKEKYYVGPVDPEYVLHKGDLIVVMTEQAEGLLGSPAVIPKNGRFLHNQRLGLLVPLRRGECDTRFLYHLFNCKEVRSQIRASASGLKVRHTSPSRIGEVKVTMPPVGVQKRIADILSSYDDLIENNRQRIKIFEEMARAIYREWFVEMRFPGHTRVRRKDTEFGSIPVEWSITTVGQAFSTVLGGTPSRSNSRFWGGSVPWINSGKVNELRVIAPTEHITDEGLRKSAAKLMPRRTTLIAITGATLGQVSLSEIETTANQSVVGVFDSGGLHSEWLYLVFRERIQEVIRRASGGAQQHINKEIVADVKIVVPSKQVILDFQAIVRPLFDEIAVLLRESAVLNATRDLLLPRLMSADVSVENVEIAAADDPLRESTEVSK